MQNWAKNKEIHARNGFTEFQKKSAAKLMTKLNVNQRVQDKLSKALQASQEMQNSIKQKYSDKNVHNIIVSTGLPRKVVSELFQQFMCTLQRFFW